MEYAQIVPLVLVSIVWFGFVYNFMGYRHEKKLTKSLQEVVRASDSDFHRINKKRILAEDRLKKLMDALGIVIEEVMEEEKNKSWTHFLQAVLLGPLSDSFCQFLLYG